MEKPTTDDVSSTENPTPEPSRPSAPTHTGEMPEAAPSHDNSTADAQADGATTDSDAPAPTDGTISADQAKLVLRRVKDPELNLNIVDLGLIYDITVDGSVVRVDMSLTSPGCPSGPEIMGEAEQQLRTIPGVSDVVMNLIWSPPWTPERIEPRVRAYMGF